MNTMTNPRSLLPAPHPDQRIAVLARGQHGVVTRAQLLEAGLSSKMVRSRLESGRLVRLHQGTYLLGTLKGDLEPPRARIVAAVLACGPGAAASHRTAGRSWLILRTPGSVGRTAPRLEVSVRWGRPRHRRIQIYRPRELPASDVTTLDGIRITTPLRTLRDLSTVLAPRELNRAAARAERLGLVSAEDLEGLPALHAGRRGAPALRSALTSDGGPTLTRSEAEERLLDLVRAASLPSPETNVTVGHYEVDFLWRQAGLVVEVDGFAHHRSRQSFENDRRRDSASWPPGSAYSGSRGGSSWRTAKAPSPASPASSGPSAPLRLAARRRPRPEDSRPGRRARPQAQSTSSAASRSRAPQ